MLILCFSLPISSFLTPYSAEEFTKSRDKYKCPGTLWDWKGKVLEREVGKEGRNTLLSSEEREIEVVHGKGGNGEDIGSCLFADFVHEV